MEFAHVRDVSSCSNMADSIRAVEREWIKASVKVDLARRVSTQKLGDLSAQLGECGESLRERGKRRKNGRFLRRTFRARRRRRNERRASRRVVGAPPKGARRRVEGEFRSQGAPRQHFEDRTRNRQGLRAPKPVFGRPATPFFPFSLFRTSLSIWMRADRRTFSKRPNARECSTAFCAIIF